MPSPSSEAGELAALAFRAVELMGDTLRRVAEAHETYRRQTASAALPATLRELAARCQNLATRLEDLETVEADFRAVLATQRVKAEQVAEVLLGAAAALTTAERGGEAGGPGVMARARRRKAADA